MRKNKNRIKEVAEMKEKINKIKQKEGYGPGGNLCSSTRKRF